MSIVALELNSALRPFVSLCLLPPALQSHPAGFMIAFLGGSFLKKKNIVNDISNALHVIFLDVMYRFVGFFSVVGNR